MTDQSRPTPLYPPDRLERAAEAAGAAGFGALLLTPGPDLRYVSGYDAHALERLTCLAMPAAGDRRSWSCRGSSCPPRRRRRPAGSAWTSSPGTRPTTRTRWSPARLGPAAGRPGGPDVGADGAPAPRPRCPAPSRAWPAPRCARCACARPRPRSRRCARPARPSTGCTRGCRAGCGPGRTEREVAADIAEAIVAEGHARADFAIVGSGPNAASPHHEPPRPGAAAPATWSSSTSAARCPSGYCSDCTRTYAIGEPPPDSPRTTRCSRTPRTRPAPRSGPGVERRVGRRRGPGADHGGRLRRALHPPDRARHRAGDARGPLHRGGQHRAARAGHGLLRRARHLPGPRTAPGSRTSWSAPTTAASGSTTSTRELVVVAA